MVGNLSSPTPVYRLFSDEMQALRLQLEASKYELETAAAAIAQREGLLEQARSWERLFSDQLVRRNDDVCNQVRQNRAI